MISFVLAAVLAAVPTAPAPLFMTPRLPVPRDVTPDPRPPIVPEKTCEP